jgi:POT family proton-dependent oligopeptide transporter
MCVGALLVAVSYLLVAAAEALTGGARAHWLWLLSYFFIFTLGELYILPNGLGIFARLAPPKLGASTVAAWYLAIFSGSLVAGQVGRLWSRVAHVPFFLILAGIATLSAVLLYFLDAPTRRILASVAERRPPDDLTDVPEGLARPSNA